MKRPKSGQIRVLEIALLKQGFFGVVFVFSCHSSYSFVFDVVLNYNVDTVDLESWPKIYLIDRVKFSID